MKLRLGKGDYKEMPEEQAVREERDLKPVNLSDVNLVDEEIEYSAEDDAFAQAQPIPDGEYLMKLFLGTGPDQKEPGPMVEVDRRGTEYIIPIEVRVADGEYKEAVLFYNATTRVPRGKRTCTIAAILAELGYKVEGRTSKVKLVKGLVAALKKEPSIIALTQWGAWDQTQGKRGAMVVRGMENFPKDSKGHVVSEFKNLNTGNMVQAKARVVRFRSAKKGAPVKGTPKATGASVGGAPKAPPKGVVEEEVLPELE